MREAAGGADEEHPSQAQAVGRHAETPAQIPWRGWKAVLRRTFNQMISDRIPLVAAGCAFYATLALFPAISVLISIYGLVFDLATVEPQLEILRGLVPPSVFNLIDDRVHALVSHGTGSLSLSLLISFLVAFWSATTGTKSVMAALNLAYDEREERSLLRYQAIAFAMTLCAVLGLVLAVALLVALPAALSFVGLVGSTQGVLIRLASFAMLLVFVLTSLSLLYRFGPSRRPPKWHWVTPGSCVATVLWLLASVLFSLYVGHVASYDATYGPLGTVVGVMMWFFVTIYVVLLGAELNAELELQTMKDSTDGPPKPMGRRGAYVADHVAD